jgi:hypothetical protein
VTKVFAIRPPRHLAAVVVVLALCVACDGPSANKVSLTVRADAGIGGPGQRVPSSTLRPAPHVSVEVVDAGGHRTSATTGADGSVVLSLVPGSYSVTCEDSSIESSPVILKDRAVQLHLPCPGPV